MLAHYIYIHAIVIKVNQDQIYNHEEMDNVEKL